MKILQRIGLALAGLVLLGFALASFQHGMRAAQADVDSLRTRWTINQWKDNTGPLFTLAVWEQSVNELRAALRLTPGDAQLFDELGALYGRRATSLRAPTAGMPEHVLQQTLLSDAIASYRQACLLRPTFPYSWAYLAVVKHLKGEADAEMWGAFDRAIRFGHNEPWVQMSVARVAFAHWETLTAERRQQVMTMIENAHPAPREELYKLAQQSGVLLLGK